MVTTPTPWSDDVTFSPSIFAIRPTVLALSDDTFVLGWEENPSANIFGRHLSALGSFTGGDFLTDVSSTFSAALSRPQFVEQADGTVIVEFRKADTSTMPTSSDLIWHEVNPDFSPSAGTVTSQSTDTPIDAATHTASGSFVTYEGSISDHTFLFLDSNGVAISGGPIGVGTPSNVPAVATRANGDVVAVWERPDLHQILMQTFTGTALNPTVVTVGSSAARPDVAITNGGTPDSATDDRIVIAFDDFAGGNIRFRRYDAQTVSPIELTPIQILGSTAGLNSKVTALKDGGFVVGWEQAFGTESDASGDFDIALQRFDKAGNQVGSRFFVDEPGDQNNFTLDTLDDGRIIVVFSNETGNATNLTTLDYMIFDPREAVIDGTSRSETITSRIDGATVNGLAGDDTLQGMGADDTLNGGTDSDHMIGRAGNDTYVVDDTADVADESTFDAAGNDTVISSINFDLSDSLRAKGAVENLTLMGSAVKGSGNAGANIMTGDKVANRLSGEQGDDTLAGRGGNDKISGGDQDDAIAGGKGNDKLFGGKGKDVLKGGKGADDLHAGKGDNKDLFAFTTKHDSGHDQPSGWDQIFQFDRKNGHEKHTDKIDLSAIDADKHQKDDQHFRFVDHFSTASGKEPDGEVTLQDAGKNVKVLVDFDGDKDADMIIEVMKIDTLHKADFIL